MSPATIDRYLAPARAKDPLRGISTTKPSPLLRSSIQVRKVFTVPKVGAIAGCMVMEGRVARGQKTRLLRDSVIVWEGNLSSLKRFKDDVKEVEKGYECGIGLENFNDIKEGDVIESYELVEVRS